MPALQQPRASPQDRSRRGRMEKASDVLEGGDTLPVKMLEAPSLPDVLAAAKHEKRTPAPYIARQINCT